MFGDARDEAVGLIARLKVRLYITLSFEYLNYGKFICIGRSIVRSTRNRRIVSSQQIAVRIRRGVQENVA
jgi:hypothetical protein